MKEKASIDKAIEMGHELVSRITKEPQRRLKIIQEFYLEKCSTGDKDEAHLALLYKSLAGEQGDSDVKIPNRAPAPDFLDSIIIVLVAAALVIFLLWATSRTMGIAAFESLPDWLQKSYNAIWTSVAAGATGIGLAIVKVLTRKRDDPHPNYLLWIGITTVTLLVLIFFMPKLFSQSRRSVEIQNRTILSPPADVVLIKMNGKKTDFALENFVPNSAVTFILKGWVIAQNGVAKGHLDSGKIKVSSVPLPTIHMNRIAFGACFQIEGNDRANFFPPTSRNSQSIDVDFALAPGSSFDVPSGDFSFPLPDRPALEQCWLCASLITPDTGGSFPAH